MQIGEKIKRLRIKNNLTQEELANRCELSKGFISQLERELTSPSIATLVDILECLGTNLKDFFSDSEPEKITFSEEDAFAQENEEKGYVINWIVPNAQKNMMEPIIVELDSNGTTELEVPHEGEEFGYVLTGAINIHLGNEVFQAKKGECFYFKSNLPHYVSNPYKRKASFLWVVTPPTF